MPGWYDIVSLTRQRTSLVWAFPLTICKAAIDGTVEALRMNEDEPGIMVSQQYFHGLIQQEIDSGIASERIVLGGFSQGGAISIFAGLTAKVKLAGIVGLSSYLLLSPKFKDLLPKPEFNKETPIFMGHGSADPVVRTELGKHSYTILKDLGYNVSWSEYELVLRHSFVTRKID